VKVESESWDKDRKNLFIDAIEREILMLYLFIKYKTYLKIYN